MPHRVATAAAALLLLKPSSCLLQDRVDGGTSREEASRGSGSRAAGKVEVESGRQTGVTPTHLLTGHRRGPAPKSPRAERISY